MMNYFMIFSLNTCFTADQGKPILVGVCVQGGGEKYFCLLIFPICWGALLSRTKIHVKQVLIDYSINMNFIIMVLIIMVNNFKWGCLVLGIFQIYQLDNTFLCLLHTNKLPDICTARSRLRKSPRRVLETNKHICSNKLTFVLMNILKKFKMPFIPILN